VPAPIPARLYADAEDYLSAVVAGTEPADAARIAAARTLIQFQRQRTRAPLGSAAKPREMARTEQMGREQDRRRAFEEKAAAIGAKRGRNGG
jgi:hypothetical protein